MNVRLKGDRVVLGGAAVTVLRAELLQPTALGGSP